MHSLTDKDLDTMTAVCAVCGPVDIKLRGPGKYRCVTAAKERSRRLTEHLETEASAMGRVRY